MMLLSSLFTLMWGFYKSAEMSAMMEMGNESNLTLNNVNIENIEDIKRSGLIEKSGISKIIGNVVNEDIEYLDSKLICCDDEYTRIKYIYIEQGTMPVSENEVFVSKKMLNLMNGEYGVGSIINLKINICDNTFIEKEFVVSGIYDGKINSKNNDVIVSEKFLNTLLDEREYGFKNIGQIDLVLKSTFFINKQIDYIKKYIGQNEDILAIINWTYEFVYPKELCVIFLLIILLIMSSGYLIIYNIFDMSITGDIKIYGILKVLGTTNIQIRKIIYRQGLRILIESIPIGGILGYTVGKAILPKINNIVMDNILLNIETELTINPWIFLFSAIFTIIVVMISINNLYKVIEKISAVEAVKYSEIDINTRKNKIDFGGRIYRIPLLNIMRNKRKAMLVVVSLSMGLILFNFIFNIVFSFNREKYINDSMEIQYDYRVDNKYFTSLASIKIDDNTGISYDLIKDMNNHNFIDDGGGITLLNCNIHSENLLNEDDMLLLTLDDFFIDRYERGNRICELKDGRYIILDSSRYSNYNTGDKILLNYDNLDEEEYEIIGFLNFHEYLNLNVNDEVNAGVIWSKNIKNEQKKGKLERYYFNVKNHVKSSEIDEYLKRYINMNDVSIIYKSKEKIEERFNLLKENYLIVGVTITLLVGLIGVLNYINSIFTEMISSVKIFALLEVIGTTKKEIKIMLICKGIYYSILASIFNILFIISVNLICKDNVFTIIPVLISTPVLLGFSVLIPLVLYDRIVKNNVIISLRVF